ncbi:hypothetical protein [Methylopila sp. M107]|uniref:hypothetical protein n=1 Tax=Methylopila sp. M107 TaxID=1101190 RepID=UPI0003701CC7|nr:hypothetical protein [Methylopila sp. M107]
MTKLRRTGAAACAAVLLAATLAPVAAEAGWRHRHGHGGGGRAGAVAAAGVLGVIAGAAIASSAARADEEPECFIEKRRVETPSGRVYIKKVRVCE